MKLRIILFIGLSQNMTCDVFYLFSQFNPLLFSAVKKTVHNIFKQNESTYSIM